MQYIYSNTAQVWLDSAYITIEINSGVSTDLNPSLQKWPTYLPLTMLYKCTVSPSKHYYYRVFNQLL